MFYSMHSFGANCLAMDGSFARGCPHDPGEDTFGLWNKSLYSPEVLADVMAAM